MSLFGKYYDKFINIIATESIRFNKLENLKDYDTNIKERALKVNYFKQRVKNILMMFPVP
jgi:hypothetical protein